MGKPRCSCRGFSFCAIHEVLALQWLIFDQERSLATTAWASLAGSTAVFRPVFRTAHVVLRPVVRTARVVLRPILREACRAIANALSASLPLPSGAFLPI
jgi:hypothetical protein